MSVAVRLPSRTMLRKRARAFRVADAVLLAAGGFVLWWGPAALVYGWFATGDQRIHRVHDIGLGALITGALLVPLVAEFMHPERKIAALQQFTAGGFALVIGGAIGTHELALFGLIFLVAAALLWLFHPAREEFFHRLEPVSKPLALLTIAGGIPLGIYASKMAALQRAGSPLDPHVKEGHWAGMAALAIGIILCAALASLRTHGWRVPGACAGLMLAVMGAASILFPGYAGSFGSGWGLTALMGGTVFALASEHQHRVDASMNN